MVNKRFSMWTSVPNVY